MLMMSRRQGETILIGDDIEIVIAHISRSRVKVGIRAPAPDGGHCTRSAPGAGGESCGGAGAIAGRTPRINCSLEAGGSCSAFPGR